MRLCPALVLGPPGSRARRLALRLAALSDSVVVLLLGEAGKARANHACLTGKCYSIDSFSRLMGKRWIAIWFEQIAAWGGLTPAPWNACRRRSRLKVQGVGNARSLSQMGLEPDRQNDPP